MKYVACYCRVSTEEQVKFGFSIDAQKRALEKYCKQNGYKAEFYIDEGISASSMNKRKALQSMLEKVNLFDMVLFTKLDRLSRNVLDANNINKLLIDNHCTMKAIDEDDIDTSTADGTFIFNLKVSLAQREIEKTSERINFVFKSKREKGEITSGTKKYGYDIINKKYEINPSESQNIVNLYEYFISVNGDYQKTYQYFIKNFEGKGKDALYLYLRDTSFIGKYKLYRKDVYIENYIPRIMEDELFFSVQNLLKKREPGNPKSQYISLFSGLILCNKCHNRMNKKVDNRCKNRLIRYSCETSYRRIVNSMDFKCNNRITMKEEVIEQYLLENINRIAQDYINKNSVVSIQQPKDNSKALTEIDHKLLKLKDLYLEDLIDKETYKSDYEKLNKRRTELTIDTQPVEKKDFTNLQNLINLNIEKIYRSLNDEEKRGFWLGIIDKIYVENGEIKEVTFL